MLEFLKKLSGAIVLIGGVVVLLFYVIRSCCLVFTFFTFSHILFLLVLLGTEERWQIFY